MAWTGLVVVVAVPSIELVVSHLLPRLTGVEAAQAHVGDSVPAASVAIPAVATTTENADAAVPDPSTPTPQPVADESPVVQAPAEDPGKAAVSATSQSASQTDTPAVSPEAVPVSVPSRPANDTSVVASSDSGATSTAPAANSAPLPNDSALKAYLAGGKPLPSYVTMSPDQNQTAGTPTAPASSAGVQPAVATAEPPPVPMPIAERPKTPPVRTVTEADLKNWKSGSLEDYLRQQGLLNETTPGATGN